MSLFEHFSLFSSLSPRLSLHRQLQWGEWNFKSVSILKFQLLSTFVVFPAQTCFFSTDHMFLTGLNSGLQEGHSKTSILAGLIWFFFTISDVCLGSVSCWNTQLHPRANHLLMILGFPEEFRDYLPSSFFPSLSLEQQIHWQQSSPTA